MRLRKYSAILLAAVWISMASPFARLQAIGGEDPPLQAVGDEKAIEPIPESMPGQGSPSKPTFLCPEFCRDACPCAWGQFEFLFMQPVSHVANQPIVEDFNSGQAVISTSDLHYGIDPGVRVTAGIRLWCCRELEFSYMGLFDGTATVDAVPGNAGLLKFPDPLGSAEDVNVFRGMDYVRACDHFALHSLELNLPCCCCCCCCDCGHLYCRSFEWFFGARYLSLNDTLNIYAERNEFGGVETGSYNLQTRNNLYGGQIGARIRRGWDRFRWELTGKAGIYGNDAYQAQTIIDYPDFPLRPTVSENHGTVAFVGELGLTFVYKLDEVWGLRAGYNLMWIEGLALAPNQLDFTFTSTSGSGLNTGAGMFLHGISLGVEARW